ncbi:hypothetical protein [Kosmotoga pacifica]|uniref:Uncharacterized protein n=1 Tax=Kosmotoga pacifica TaxID=1330330 RepID=A0A0G2Z4P3_9BACT|nr:hypothetical protein [Kosmotoga pacifica]AKI96580.1 hypothetical protein IX53_00700 [Kosmotoga pacifica]
MTNLEYARLLINDKDQNNLIFSDTELQEIISLNSEVKVVEAEPKSLDKTLWQIPFRHLDETYTEKIYNEYEEELSGTVDKVTGEITLDTAYDGYVFVQAKIVHWNDIQADCFEMIATDIRRWNSYSAGGLSETFSKAELLAVARNLRSPRGAEL